ncbi:MAG: alanine--tRNA ligase, partial [Bdellovibrionales bacterium]|nr:alanine--tRNA ligase [Bdellovibrionales bacterium]
HHTFFEMLGNFSFGDYFKKDAIHFAWEFITKEMGIDKNRLYVSVFQNDDEAAEIWEKQEKVSKDRIYRYGEKDNFWRMGDTGPCGPCSEIFIDLGPEVPGNPKDNVMGGEGDRFMEIWNLVFMQFNETEEGKQIPLPKPSVDTGMGLERLSAVMQGEISNYHSDLFMDLIERATRVSGVKYLKTLKDLNPKEKLSYEKSNMALRVLADHARASAFLIGDGVLPSNDGRGYVLRRIMRRGIRYGRQLTENSVLPDVVDQVIQKMCDVYPELNQQKNLILSTVKDEEQRFLQTLDQGTLILNDSLNKLKSKNQTTVDGDLVFKLYDTFGFPVDLTRIMAREQGFQVDEKGFEDKMQEARNKAKASWKGKTISGDAAHLVTFSQDLFKKNGATEFKGYETTTLNEAKILGLSNGTTATSKLRTGESGILITDKTCFYAEGGGQVGDSGVIQTSQGMADVLDCTKQNNVFLHHIQVKDGQLQVNDICQLKVTELDRRSTAANHSATHLLHSALRKTLGEHVQQAGSLVDAERLRFDFTHNKPLSNEEVEKIEVLVNSEIARGTQVISKVTSHQQAIAEGALALFGEKYGDEVRVIRMGDFSTELCGGTHVNNTSAIRVFKIVSESGVSSGVRRIEAITGDAATRFLMKNTTENQKAREISGLNENWIQYLNDQKYFVSEHIQNLKIQVRNLEKEVQALKGNNISIDNLLNSAKKFSKNGIESQLILADIPMDDRKVLSDLSDKLKNKIQSGVIVLIGKGEASHPLIVTVSKNLTKDLPAGQLLKAVAETLGGKGGGRPDFAQGAVSDRSQIEKAFAKASEFVGANS